MIRNDLQQSVQEAERRTKDLAKDAAESLSQKVGNVSQKVQEATDDIERRAMEASRDLQQKTQQFTRQVKEKVQPLVEPEGTFINYLHIFGIAPALAWLAYKPEYVRYTPAVAGAIAAMHGVIAYNKNNRNTQLRSKL